MAIYVFIISLLLLIVFIALKVWEQKKSKKTPVTDFLAKGDAYIFKANAKMQYALHDNKQKTIFFLLFHLPEQIELFFRELKKRAHDKYHRTTEKVRGKQTLNSGGDVSPFMRDLGAKDEEK